MLYDAKCALPWWIFPVKFRILLFGGKDIRGKTILIKSLVVSFRSRHFNAICASWSDTSHQSSAAWVVKCDKRKEEGDGRGGEKEGGRREGEGDRRGGKRKEEKRSK